ncbi:BppU family phage baseplate upper protein [Bacillus subtilis]|uniref:phage baseplate upper protein n=1 Tax=Bacillus sp. FSL W8-0812 TaxID=2954633 RepID=UPI002DB8F418|nr:BppU family phage baseplate upper protein [Bacillus subtilis]MEC1876487.1 BppU family phage baseplate upper protein [Bacillus subtilis]MEC1936838.1 BppU family phage baseplate upper protein [Bacillus subtilis]
MIYKDANVTYDINSRRSDGRATNIQFMTQDTGSAKLSFSFTKDGVPLPLSAVDTKIVLLYSDGSFYKKSLTIIDKVNGKAEYILSDAELKHPGIVKAELKLYYTNGQALATSFFTFTISKTLEDQNIVPIAEYYIDDFEMLRDEISQTLDEIKAKFDEFENIETKAGAQEKADKAEANAKAYTDVHANNKTIHITADERTTWNAKETTSGSKSKADKALVDAKAYTDEHTADTVKHITAAERTKWNGAQLSKITADHGGVSIAANEGEDILKKIVDQGRTMGTFYAHGKAINAPSTVSTRGIFHLTGLASDGKGMYGWVYATDYKNNVFTNYYDGSTTYWQGWKRSLNTDDLLYSYANITLKNGATAGTRTPIYAKWGPLTLLRGHVKTEPEIIFGSIPSSYAPIGGAVVTVPLSGTGGTANLIVYENGDLKIKYPDPADSSKLGGGYYIDVVIGFQEGGTA